MTFFQKISKAPTTLEAKLADVHCSWEKNKRETEKKCAKAAEKAARPENIFPIATIKEMKKSNLTTLLPKYIEKAQVFVDSLTDLEEREQVKIKI